MPFSHSPHDYKTFNVFPVKHCYAAWFVLLFKAHELYSIYMYLENCRLDQFAKEVERKPKLRMQEWYICPSLFRFCNIDETAIMWPAK